MKRRELLISIFIIVVLLAINTINFMRRESVRRNNIFIVEEGRIELSLNTVSAVELCDLPGVGPVLAERIVAYREQKGGFKSLEELKEVKGIGDKTYNRICPYVKL